MKMPKEQLPRALSIRQPYVEAIFRGTKDAEYRSRPCRIRERVYLYASLKPGDVEYGEELGIPRKDQPNLARGGILGSVEITDCQWDDEHDCFAWKLERPTRYGQLFRAIGQPQPAFWFPRWK